MKYVSSVWKFTADTCHATAAPVKQGSPYGGGFPKRTLTCDLDVAFNIQNQYLA